MKLRISIVMLLLAYFVYAQSNDIIFQQIKNAGSSVDNDGASTVVIFDTTQVKMMDSGLSHVHNHKLIKVLTEEGAVALRYQTFNYDTLSAFIDIEAANIYKNDGRVIHLDQSHIHDYQAPARAIYWGARDRMIAFGRLETGDAIEIKMYKKGFSYALLYDENDNRYIPPMKGHYYDIVLFYSSTPILSKYYEVSIPARKKLQYEIYNGEIQSSLMFAGDQTKYLWSKENIKPFKQEPHMVSPSDEYCKLLMSTAENWEAKSTWFYGVNENFGSFEYTPEIKAKTDEIIKGAKDDLDKIERLTHWVAEEIRYSGLSMGEGEGFTLHKGEMTFTDRCGVCKDKAGMLVTMLRAAGFESFAAMTMAGERIDRIPADQFNHSVTVVKYNGQYMLLDPTWVPGVRELWSSAEQQQGYLMGVPEGAPLMVTPISDPAEHYYKVNGESELLNDGTLKGKLVIAAEKQSDSRFRRLLKGTYKAGWENTLLELAETISSNIEVSNIKYTDPYDLSRPMTISFDYTIPNYAMVTENALHFKPVVAGFPFRHRYVNGTLTMNVNMESRKTAFRTGCSRLSELSETIKLPKGYRIEKLPEYDSVTGSGADFEAQYELKGGKLVFYEKLVEKKRVYEVEDWESFRSAVKSANQVSDDILILEK
ncbi:MAG: DUF3857 and transglutaminase domain-containing protein [Candidatus Marinimicrobia bacterium]|nr:DUF3857 and transglutaminase domain-containing protein [Candidatus Neomarinimicrobiota bacterium]